MADILRILGISIYVLTSVIDRFFHPIPDGLYIILAVIAIICLFAGMIIKKKK